MIFFCLFVCLQAGVKHIVLAVSYRAEMLEQEMTVEAQKVSSEISHGLHSEYSC